MATTPATDPKSATNLSGTSAQSTLSEWAGPYVTDMLAKAKALSETPYQTYQGPMTAGASNLQNKVFQGLGALSFPGNLGQSFAGMTGGNMTSQHTAGGMGPYRPEMHSQSHPPPFQLGQGMEPPSYVVEGRPYRPYPNDPYQPGMEPLLGPPSPQFEQVQQPGSNAPASPANAEDAWRNFSAMAHFGPGTNMEQEKQAFMANWNAKNTGSPTPMQASLGAAAPAQTSPSAPARSVAEQYMNPYLQQVLQPQLAELQRQSQVNLQPSLAKLTQAGGFGGGRQAIMESEANRNLLQEQNKTVGQAYSNAFDKAMQQFNTEQTQAQDLAKLMGAAGAAERDIEQQGITADYNEFLAQRDYPQKQLQFMQSMLQGLPISTVAYQPAQASGIGKLNETVGGLGSLIESLKTLNL